MNINSRSTVAPLLFALVAAPLFAATAFEDSIPIELARQFLGNPAIGEAMLYQDIMDEFPPFTVPPAFEVLGSIDQIYSHRVVLSTTLDPEAAKVAITEAFTSAGWQVIDFNNGRPAQQGGFIAATQPALPETVCHDDHGMMQVSVNSSDTGQLVNLSRSTAAMQGFAGRFGATSPCDPARFGPGNMMGPGGPGGVMAHMPTLVVPEAPAARNLPGMSVRGGGGGSTNDFESSTPLNSELSLRELYAHFAEQILEQGWAEDSAGIGSFLATGSYTKTVEGDVELIGILNVLEVAENGFDLKFRILRRGNRVVGGVIDSPAVGFVGPAAAVAGITSVAVSGVNGETGVRVLTTIETGQSLPTRAVSFPISDFRPAHADDRRYYVVEFGERSSNVVRGQANAEGVYSELSGSQQPHASD